jgi:hypothetical protein
MRPMLPLTVLLPLLACAPALRANGDGWIDVAVPPGWRVARNVAAFGGATVALVAPDGQANVTLQLVRDTPRARELPLDLLAETRAFYMGRTLGYQSSVVRLDEIEVGGRPAWAATGTVRWHQAAGDYSLVALRTDRHVAFVTLVAPPGGLNAALPGWTIVLDTLRFPRSPGEPPPPFDGSD